jgi:hypothetical protein
MSEAMGSNIDELPNLPEGGGVVAGHIERSIASAADFIEAEELEASEAPRVLWEPHPGPQRHLLRCPIYEVLYGGARGGGKTDGMLADWAQHAFLYGAAARGVFFRRTLPQLEDVIRRSKELFGPLGAVYQKSAKTWLMPGGATLKFRYLLRDEDAEEYKGQQYTWVCFEELTQWAVPEPVDKIRACLRSAEGVPVFFRATTNPGGPGHGWVKARYVSPAPMGYRPIADPTTGLERCYIPARLENNPTLEKNDPTYRTRLRSLGSSALVEAWLNGSWDIADGGIFSDVWSERRHIIPIDRSRPFRVPLSWRLLRSFDWGSSKPSSLGIWAESDGSGQELTDRHERSFPAGTLVRIAEWYTVKRDGMGLPLPNKGLGLSNEEIGERIARISKGRTWDGCVADPAIFTRSGGPSIYDRMKEGAERIGEDLSFRKADNSRIPGWAELRDRLDAGLSEHPERPALYVLSSCVDWIRTVPILPRDARRGDDVDTKAEDHAGDETRYACMIKGGGMSTTGIAA